MPHPHTYTLSLLEAIMPLVPGYSIETAATRLELELSEGEWDTAKSAADTAIGTAPTELASEPLQPIMAAIRLHKKVKKPRQLGFHPQALDLKGSAFFPQEWEKIQGQYPGAVSELQAGAQEALEVVIEQFANASNLPALNSRLFHLLKQFGSRVAVDLPDSLDVSLFDQARIRTAWHACQISAGDWKNEDFALIKLDLSGIQKFIFGGFNLSNIGEGRGLAKRLRGRSTYVTLLTDFCAGELLKEMGLQEANLILNSAGVLLFLAPLSATAGIKAILKSINIYLLGKLGTHLGLVAAIEPCDKTIFSNAAGKLTQVSHQLDAEQYRRHASYLRAYFDGTGRTSFNEDKTIGKRTPKAGRIIKIRIKEGVENWPKKYVAASFPPFRTYYLMDNEINRDDALDAYLQAHADLTESTATIQFNDFKIEADSIGTASFQTQLTGKYAPVETVLVEEGEKTFRRSQVVEFEDLAEWNWSHGKTKAQTLNFPQLGVLRMDIDDLGAIFALGLGDNVPLARLSALSREMDLFFGGWLNGLAEKWGVYITYSGGDDGFVVGSWINVAHFAKELNAAFRRFAVQNPNLTLSAGLYVCRPFYPVGKFAHKAASLEDLAKTFLRKDELVPRKNSIAIFDNVLHWKEFGRMIGFAQKMERCTEQKGGEGNRQKLARSLIQRIHQMISNSLTRSGNIDARKMYRYRGQLHFLFSRHGFSKEEIHKMTQSIVKEVIETFLTEFNSEDSLKNYLISTQYLLMVTRQPK